MFSLLGARLYPLGPDADAEANLALDEALLRAGAGSPDGTGDRPLLWLWRNPPCVVVGRGQRIEREAGLAACRRDRIPVLRRATGGGTVYHDGGNLNISLVTADGPAAPLRQLGALLGAVVSELGLTPRLTERGLFAGEGKLCGFAALRSRGAVLAHSTLLVSTPPEAVRRYLAPPPAVPHPLDSRRGAVTSLAAHGIRPSDAELAAVITACASRLFGPPCPRTARPAERCWARRLLAARYRYPPWHQSGTQKNDRLAGHEHEKDRPARREHDNDRSAGREEEEEEEAWTAQRESICTG